MRFFSFTQASFFLLLCNLVFNGLFALIQCHFLISFTCVKSKTSHYVIYITMFYLISLAEHLFLPQNGQDLAFNMQDMAFLESILILYLFLHWILKQTHAVSMITAILTNTINALIEGLMAPFQRLSERWITSEWMWMGINFGFNVVILCLTLLFYHYLVKHFRLKQPNQTPYLLILVAPLLLITITLRFLLASEYSLHVFGEAVRFSYTDYKFLLITLLSVACVYTCLYAFQKILSYFQTEQEKRLLEQELRLQKKYIEESRSRYEKTRALRHDLQNHILVLHGLLEQRQYGEAEKYLDQFSELVTAHLSFPIQTGNTTVDVLLGEKLANAKQNGIEISCNIVLPKEMNVLDFDLCTILANSLDNAIRACKKAEPKWIHIRIVPKNQFLLIEMQNSYVPGKTPHGTGLGLPGIKNAVQQYDGIVEIKEQDNVYQLSILLPFS